MNSFLTGKKTLSIPQLRPHHPAQPSFTSASVGSPAAPRSPTGLHAHAAGGDPSVEVVKEGDKVVRLIVVCTCGERVEIECLYPAGT
jgi:hypothetical protein